MFELTIFSIDLANSQHQTSINFWRKKKRELNFLDVMKKTCCSCFRTHQIFWFGWIYASLSIRMVARSACPSISSMTPLFSVERLYLNQRKRVESTQLLYVVLLNPAPMHRPRLMTELRRHAQGYRRTDEWKTHKRPFVREAREGRSVLLLRQTASDVSALTVLLEKLFLLTLESRS